MAIMDYIQSGVEKVLRPKRGGLSSMGPGIGSSTGVAAFQADMIVSKPVIIFHSSQAFFNFLAMCCFASVASFQAKWDVGPSGLSGFALFVSIFCLLLALVLVLVPWADGKYGRLTNLARVLTETRVAFILSATGFGLDLLIAFVTTISAWTEAGCKNADNDPNADKGDDFKDGLSGWCSTKKAGAIFFWIAFAFWIGTVWINIQNWRNGKARGPRDPPFRPPMDTEAGDGAYDELEEEEEEREQQYGRVPNLRDNTEANASPFADSNATNRVSTASSYVLPPVSGVGNFNSSMPASRPSMDAYGAFSDPAPTGYGHSAQPSFSDASGLNSTSPTGVSRTMQYADPYAAVRASIVGTPPAAPQNPPGYSEYSGYR